MPPTAAKPLAALRLPLAALRHVLMRQSVLSFILATTALFALSLLNMPEKMDAPPLLQIGTPDIPEFSPTTTQETEFTEEAVAAADTTVTEAEVEVEESWLEYRIRRGDNMDKVLRKIKAGDDIRSHILSQKLKSHRRLRIGDTIYFKLREGGDLSELLYKTSPDYYLLAGRDATNTPWVREEAPDVRSESRHIGGVIDSSLFAAADAAGMSDAAIDRLINVLETQIDFYRDVRKGDTFRVIYEEWRDQYGDVVKIGDILAFEYDNRLRSRPRIITGAASPQRDQYYTPEGESMRRAFLPAPLKFRRISSRFSLKRFHPVLKRNRPHRGVDYAARTGTPVRSTADGVIIKSTKERGYGNVVMIKHFNIYTTVYAHLRGFAAGVRKGRRVRQGDIIGYVGQTGLATGPHLHYEFRVRGKHKDPLAVDLPKQLPPLTGEELKAFQQHSAPVLAQLRAIPLP